jgi:hypothetical protein
VSKDRSKEILREISSLKRELEGRLDAIEARMGPSPPEAEPASGASVSTFSLPAGSEVKPAGRSMPAAVTSDATLSAVAPSGPPWEVLLSVRPLVDVGLARAIESSLNETDGIESARLMSLSGDSAVIQALVASGVSVVNTLRRRLPVAFDVTESSDHAISIELARAEEDEARIHAETEAEH